MCPICIGAAALAWVGTGSAGGLAAAVAVKLHCKRRPEDGSANELIVPEDAMQPCIEGEKQ